MCEENVESPRINSKLIFSYDLMMDYNDIKDKTMPGMIVSHFLQIPCNGKIAFLTKAILKTTKIASLTEILNTFIPLESKLIFYSKATHDAILLEECYIRDDGNLDKIVLNRALIEDLEWLSCLDDKKKINLITELMLLLDQECLKKIYWRLVKVHNGRIHGKLGQNYASDTTLNFMEGKLFAYRISENETVHKNLPQSDLMRQWKNKMIHLGNEIESIVWELNSRSEWNNLDWIQLLPIWIVKRIFNYLDEKTLKNLAKVNEYWATVSQQVLQERKTRKKINNAMKNSKKIFNKLLRSELESTTDNKSMAASDIRTKLERTRKVVESKLEATRTDTLLSRTLKLTRNRYSPILALLEAVPSRVPKAPSLWEFQTEKSTQEDISMDFNQSASIISLSSLHPPIDASSSDMQTW